MLVPFSKMLGCWLTRSLPPPTCPPAAPPPLPTKSFRSAPRIRRPMRTGVGHVVCNHVALGFISEERQTPSRPLPSMALAPTDRVSGADPYRRVGYPKNRGVSRGGMLARARAGVMLARVPTRTDGQRERRPARVGCATGGASHYAL